MLKPSFKHGEKIEVVINNERKEFRRKRTGDSASQTNYVDEIEAVHTTTIAALKNWILKNYICIDTLNRTIIEDYKNQIKPDVEVFKSFLFFIVYFLVSFIVNKLG